MGRKDKVVQRFITLPKDFTYEETLRLMRLFGYVEDTRGHTSGSRVRFRNAEIDSYVDIHRPHPGSIMKEWMLKAIKLHLIKVGLLKD